MNNLLTAWSELFVAALVARGIRDVVVCPGSRSTPLVLAVCRRDDLEVVSIVDERSAAFFALGRARVTGRPTAVICTSGTAGAHFYPAVLEAEAAAVPLLLITADRPHELVDAGAPQTMEQRGLFGGHVRAEIELGLPDPHPRALDGVVRAAVRAVHRTVSPTPGPVHVNFRARKPLEYAAAQTEAERALADAVADRAARVPDVTAPVARASDSTIAEVRALVAGSQRPMVVAGPLAAPAKAALRFASAIGAPLCADVASGLRVADEPAVIDAADAFLDTTSLRPDLVLRIGAPPTVTAWARYFERHRAPTIVFDAHVLSDPYGTATRFVPGDVAANVEGLAACATTSNADPSWLAAWRRANATARAAIAELPWSEARATAALVSALPTNALLMAGNSLAIRHLDLYAPPFEQRVLAQRGVNGIDGLVAGAAGAAVAAKAPLALMLGDVSLLHDVGSLRLAALVSTPLVIVVLDNGGGRIFEMLPLAAREPSEEVMQKFTTPPGLRIDAAAAAFGVRYRRAEDERALRSSLDEAWTCEGATIVHVVVPPHDATKILARVREACRT